MIIYRKSIPRFDSLASHPGNKNSGGQQRRIQPIARRPLPGNTPDKSLFEIELGTGGCPSPTF